MGICVKCKKFLPPNFMVEVGEEKHKMCVFCKDEVDHIIIKEKTGERKITKNEVIKEYDIMLKKLMERPNISSLLKFSDAFNDEGVIKS